MRPPEEPLLLSAPLARSLAPGTCYQDLASGWSCCWYHAVWQYLRLLGPVTSPREHAGATIDALRSLAHDGECHRVLISGTADYSMLAYVLAAWRAESRSVEPTVVDICQTPLALNRWYAEREGIAIDTQASNILDYASGTPFDVICCHSFMGYFDADGRDALARRWHALLRPGGRVFTVHRIRPDCPTDTVGFSPDQAREFRERVLAEARCSTLPVELDLDWLAEAIDHYTADFQIYPVPSIQALTRHFERAGFRIDECLAGDVESRTAGGLCGPAVAEDANFVRITATRTGSRT